MKLPHPVVVAVLLSPLCLVVLSVTPSGASGATMVSNLGQLGSGSVWAFDTTGDAAAVEFQTDGESLWNLNSANLEFSRGTSLLNTPILVGIASDVGGAPGSILGSVQQDAPPSPTIVSFPFSGVVLAPNTSYWLEAARKDDTMFPLDFAGIWAGWQSSATPTDAGSIWTTLGFAGGFFGGIGGWTSLDRMGAFSLEATPTPEPASLVLFGLGAFGLLLAAYRRRLGKS